LPCQIAYHVTPAVNLNSILQDGLQPRIGERSADLGERLPRVYLFADEESCDTALSGWLGDSFEDIPEDGLLVLRVDVTDLTLEIEVGYEISMRPAKSSTQPRKAGTWLLSA
jgi:hypothetical protein